jgi:hypothetical protein
MLRLNNEGWGMLKKGDGARVNEFFEVAAEFS